MGESVYKRVLEDRQGIFTASHCSRHMYSYIKPHTHASSMGNHKVTEDQQIRSENNGKKNMYNRTRSDENV